MLSARVVPVRASPISVARALADRPGFAFLFDPTGSRSFVCCDPVAESRALDPEPALEHSAPLRDLERAPRWVGLLPYEARRELERSTLADPRSEPDLVTPLWKRYAAVVEIGERVRVVGEDPARVADLAGAVARASGAARTPHLRLREPEPDVLHADRVRRALDLIARGDVYVVNLARRFDFDVSGHPLELMTALARRAPAPFSAAVSWDALGVASVSPELFLRTHPRGSVETWPIKGTRPRGAEARVDRALADELEHDPKERAELAMGVDVERNDLGRVAVPGSVRLSRAPAVETQRTVHHRVARVTALVRPGVTRSELLAAMLPSGSVTGAPKVRAMEIIAELEAQRRGLYTGAFGMLRHDGSLELAMAIRTLTLRGATASYFAGGGIVADSDPDREVEETRWKAVQVLERVAG
jgi:anthranilate/para-aminobenzoate synthase component I